MVKKPYVCSRGERPLEWIGNSLQVLRSFPDDVKIAFGYQLHSVQQGRTPENAKPAEVPGVMKLVENEDGETYRVAYVVKFKMAIYVLHAFQKKSTTGIRTPQKEIELIRSRWKLAAQRDKERDQSNQTEG